MADCCKIIRLLKEVNRKADTSFYEINRKIEHLESKYNILTLQNDQLKKDVEEQKSKMALIMPQSAEVRAAPSTLVGRLKTRRRNKSRLRKLGGSKSAKSSKVSVKRKRSAKSACRPKKKRALSVKRAKSANPPKRSKSRRAKRRRSCYRPIKC